MMMTMMMMTMYHPTLSNFMNDGHYIELSPINIDPVGGTLPVIIHDYYDDTFRCLETELQIYYLT